VILILVFLTFYVDVCTVHLVQFYFDVCTLHTGTFNFDACTVNLVQIIFMYYRASFTDYFDVCTLHTGTFHFDACTVHLVQIIFMYYRASCTDYFYVLPCILVQLILMYVPRILYRFLSIPTNAKHIYFKKTP
jgi:hypothetical protein